MKFVNNMSILIDKISTRLGVDNMMSKLPTQVNKYKWVELIQGDILDLYSRYYPHCIKYKCVPIRDYNKNTGLYIINDDFIKSKGVKILGIKGVSNEEKKTSMMPSGFVYINDAYSLGHSDPIHSSIDIVQGLTNYSYFPDQLFIEFYPPNGFKITNIDFINLLENRDSIELDILINHPKNLITISQTALNLFEDLCTCKIAELIYGHLKYFDGIETGYQTIDLKLDTIQDWIARTDDIINTINDSYVSIANRYQPAFYII